MSAEPVIISDERKEWLARRRSGIGGSDVAGIMGLSRWSTPLSVYLDKVGKIADKPESEWMKWGNILEQPIADEFANIANKKVQRKKALLRHKSCDFLIANIDRKVVGEKAPLEVKTSSAYKSEEWNESIPDDYMLQCQHYISVGDFDYAYLAVLIGGQDFRWFKVPRDDVFINDVMIPSVKDFWINHVEKRIPPAPSASDIDRHLLGELYSNPSDDVIKLGKTVSELASQHSQLGRQIKSLEELRTQIGNNICKEIGSHTKATCEGFKISWKPQLTRRIDTNRIKTELPELAKEFTKISESRPLRVTETKEKTHD